MCVMNELRANFSSLSIRNVECSWVIVHPDVSLTLAATCRRRVTAITLRFLSVCQSVCTGHGWSRAGHVQKLFI